MSYFLFVCSCAQKQKRRHFHIKVNSAKLYIYIGVGARDLCIDEAHTALDIFRFAVFFIYIFTLFRLFIKYNYDLFYLIFLSLTWPMRSNKVLQDTRQTNKQTVSSIWTVVSQLKIDRISWILEPAAGKITAWMSWVVFGCPPDATVLWFFVLHLLFCV